MAADSKNRATRRSAGVICRMTHEEREELKLLAAGAGVTVRTIILRQAFNRPATHAAPHGPRPALAPRRFPPPRGWRPSSSRPG